MHRRSTSQCYHSFTLVFGTVTEGFDVVKSIEAVGSSPSGKTRVSGVIILHKVLFCFSLRVLSLIMFPILLRHLLKSQPVVNCRKQFASRYSHGLYPEDIELGL